MFGVVLRKPFLCPIAFAGLLSGLELRSTTSALPGMLALLLGKWYMLAVLIAGVGGGVFTTSLSLLTELSSLVRLLDGERGAVALFGFCCVVKRSLIVLPECFRFLSPEAEDIGGERVEKVSLG